ncbi:unnamed protein product [Soboliphyme baturini]|uniref:Calmodulin n=1 Tax=Soboliphyme baturini TaxID=241478 RepID=A0A183IH26_9BILA|nr:unnamed protein product [Soboliphyme baturini]
MYASMQNSLKEAERSRSSTTSVSELHLPNSVKYNYAVLSEVEEVASSSASAAAAKPNLRQAGSSTASCQDPPNGGVCDQLDDETLEQYRSAFRLIDKNDDGVISASEVASVMRFLGYKPTDDEIRNIIAKIDQDGNGTIEFDEFVPLMSRHSKKADKENDLFITFKVFDRNGDGYITKEELRHVMESLGEELTDEEMDMMLKAADKDGDNRVSFDEFKSMFAND